MLMKGELVSVPYRGEVWWEVVKRDHTGGSKYPLITETLGPAKHCISLQVFLQLTSNFSHKKK